MEEREKPQPEFVYVHPLVDTAGQLVIALMMAAACMLGGVAGVRAACGTCSEASMQTKAERPAEKEVSLRSNERNHACIEGGDGELFRLTSSDIFIN
jgi:hypothetical protein